MSDPLDVVSLAEAKRMLSVGAVDTKDNDHLERLVTVVSRRLDKLVGPIVQRTVTAEQHDGCSGAVWTYLAPCEVITTVVEDGVTLSASDYHAEVYEPDPSLYRGEIVRLSGGWPTFWSPGFHNVQVTYTAGRFEDTASVGAVYKEAAALMLKNLWRAYNENVGQVNEYDVPVSNFPTFAVPQVVRDLLHSELQPEVGF